jgi:four helix bundle protein
MTIHHFWDLDVWKKAHEGTLRIYPQTTSFPREERYGLARQMRDAAVSVPANIAEGFGRRSARDKAHFYTMSLGSTEEVRYFLILAPALKFMRDDLELRALYTDVARMLQRLIDATERGGSARDS